MKSLPICFLALALAGILLTACGAPSEDGSYTLNTLIAQTVTKDGVKAGTEADITYYGDLEDEEVPAVATKM